MPGGGFIGSPKERRKYNRNALIFLTFVLGYSTILSYCTPKREYQTKVAEGIVLGESYNPPSSATSPTHSFTIRTDEGEIVELVSYEDLARRVDARISVDKRVKVCYITPIRCEGDNRYYGRRG